MPLDLTAPRVQVADDVAHVLLGGHDLDGRRPARAAAGLAWLGRFLERHRAGDLERHLGAVDVVVRAEGEPGPHVDERVAGEHAALHRLLDAGVDRGDVLAGDHAALDLVDELVAAAGTGGLERDHDVAVLAATTGLADVALLDLLDRLS